MSMSDKAGISEIAVHLPEGTLTNEALASLYPDWTADKILAKTGIRVRHIAAAHETAGDLAEAAARKLFAQGVCAPQDIDFVLLCTQAPDHVLPTTACILQHRLGIGRHAGALDINLGCSGFVYGLSLAKGLIETGAARRLLLLTADTYSKYIHPMDKSVRTLFGDAAAATLVQAQTAGERIGPFVFGTDGSGAGDLIVQAGAFRNPCSPITGLETVDDSGNTRSLNHLYMNGANVMAFSLTEVPRAIQTLLERSGTTMDDYEYVVLHQANLFMLEALRKKLKLPREKVPVHVETFGNTVSSTIPIALSEMLREGKIGRNNRVMLVGFGVGLSWAATSVLI